MNINFNSMVLDHNLEAFKLPGDWGGKSCFSYTNPPNFWWLLQLPDIQLKIHRPPTFNMLFQFLLTEFSKSGLFSC